MDMEGEWLLGKRGTVLLIVILVGGNVRCNLTPPHEWAVMG